MPNRPKKKNKESEQYQKQMEVSKQIQTILEENQMALQPFLSFSEYGVLPRVRLVGTNNQNNNEQPEDAEGTDTPEAGGGEEQSQPADAE